MPTPHPVIPPRADAGLSRIWPYPAIGDTPAMESTRLVDSSTGGESWPAWLTSALLDNAAEGLIAYDSQRHLIVSNRGARALHGLSDADVSPARWAERFHRYTHPATGLPIGTGELPLVRALHGDRLRGERVLIRACDGAPRLLGVDGGAVHDRDGRLQGAVVAMHDLGDDRRARWRAPAADVSARSTVELESALQELREASARLGASVEDERRRIERDLHDGAQQRLVAMRVRLGLMREMLDSDPARAGELLLTLDEDVDEALVELRQLAHGLCPPVLADHGLGDALRSAGRIGPLPVTVEVRGLRRYSQSIEGAVYFSVREALQNAAKHAIGATHIVVTLIDDGWLRFSVADDGCGFDASQTERGAGLANMHDRLVAGGGVLEVVSAPGRGTRVTGTIPAPEAVGVERAGYPSPEPVPLDRRRRVR